LTKTRSIVIDNQQGSIEYSPVSAQTKWYESYAARRTWLSNY